MSVAQLHVRIVQTLDASTRFSATVSLVPVQKTVKRY